MGTNTSDSTHNNTSHEDWMPLPASQCIPWLVVLITECLAIVILNIITIIVFVKQGKLQRRSTYLVIHLAIVDLLVGAVSGPLNIEVVGIFFCDLWDNNWPVNAWSTVLESLRLTFPFVSLLNLTFISLERVHATFCPFKYRLIKKWVYGVIITVIWLVLMIVAVGVGLYHNYYLKFVFILSYYFTLFLVVCVCYISIYIKVRCSRHPQHHGAAGLRERKMTSTLFIVTLGSLLTNLPMITWYSVTVFNSPLLFGALLFSLWMITTLFFLGNSLINPIIYAMRMPELRAGILQIIFRRAPNRLNRVDLPLQNL